MKTTIEIRFEPNSTIAREKAKVIELTQSEYDNFIEDIRTLRDVISKKFVKWLSININGQEVIVTPDEIERFLNSIPNKSPKSITDYLKDNVTPIPCAPNKWWWGDNTLVPIHPQGSPFIDAPPVLPEPYIYFGGEKWIQPA